MINFHSLSSKEQDDIRREYKNKYNKEYSYSIKLFILYVVLGIIAILGLYIMLYKDVMIGSIIFTLGIIFLIIDLYFLELSNEKFYRFLKKKGFIYK